ncbi:MAG: ATP-NAD kinase family protein [Chloroflexota bacterium]
MATVGIIANPASGRDIRRLVAHGSVFSNNEKVNIVRRILLGLDAAGVDHVLFMPDIFRIGPRALDTLNLRLAVDTLNMIVQDAAADSSVAAALMAAEGVACIITLGGDGTNRAVAKGSGATPLLALSTGTNNVFPVMMEGTVAGLAAGVLATGKVSMEEATVPTKRIEVFLDGEFVDIALVDAAISGDVFVGARAIWDPARLKHLVLARAGIHYIGLSSIGGAARPEGLADDEGLYLELGEGGKTVVAPIAPGLIHRVSVAAQRVLRLGEVVELELGNCTVALDGERELEIGRPRRVGFSLTANGPRVIDVPRALAEAARRGLFLDGALGR